MILAYCSVKCFKYDLENRPINEWAHAGAPYFLTQITDAAVQEDAPANITNGNKKRNKQEYMYVKTDLKFH